MASSKPKILVLGATGKVGNQTVHLLSQTDDVQVIAGVRSPEKVQQLRDRNIEIRQLDLDRHETLTPALEGIDRALLLTGYSVDLLKHCVYTQLKLNAANKIPCADATFDNFEEITRRKPMTW